MYECDIMLQLFEVDDVLGSQEKLLFCLPRVRKYKDVKKFHFTKEL